MDAPAPVTDGRRARAYEREIADDLARKAFLVAPAVVLALGLARGADAAAAAAIGIGLVVLNLAASARLITWAAERSPNAVLGAVLFGYLVRIGVIFGVLVAFDQVSWIDMPVLVLTVVVTHLGLLVWELPRVSLSLGNPGLRPTRTLGKQGK